MVQAFLAGPMLRVQGVCKILRIVTNRRQAHYQGGIYQWLTKTFLL